MQLNRKKELAAKVLNVGKGRIVFMPESASEIKEAITRQDILDLYKSGAIQIKEVRGRKTIVKRKHKRGVGKIKKRVPKKKRKYVMLTRKLRSVAKNLKNNKKIDNDKYRDVRKMIKASKFKSKRHLIEHTNE